MDVRLFAVARQRCGCTSVVIPLPEGATVGELRIALARAAPALGELLPRMMIAVDSEYATDDCIIPPSAEVAVIPPVSGG